MLSTPFFVDNVDNSVYNLFLGMFSVVNYVDNLWTVCLQNWPVWKNPGFFVQFRQKRF